ncbi:MAG: hypothetical protein HY763_17265 [Planctomycetes bacterium]|nr:hypothetical protein [Planctomycetota bacterium]
MLPTNFRSARLVVAVGFLAFVAACSVSLGPGDAGSGVVATVTIANKTFVFRLGGTGLFEVRAGAAPTLKAGLVQPLFDPPADRPASGVIALDAADIDVVPLSTGKVAVSQQDLAGTAQLAMRLANASAEEPCSVGVSLGTVVLTLQSGAVALDRTTLPLSAEALEFVITGTFTICLEMSADVDVRITIDELSVQFGAGVDDGGGTVDDDAPGDGSGDGDGAGGDGTDDGVVDGDEPGGGTDGTDGGDDVTPDDGSGDGGLFPATIEYRETLTAIVREDDVNGWFPEETHSIEGVAASADGSKVAFLVSACGALSEDPDCWHLYVVDADGSDLMDLTPSLPADRAGLSTLAVTDTGGRVFFRTPLFGVIHDVYYCDVAGAACAAACLDINNSGGHKPYSIDGAGTRLFFKHNAGWDPVANKTQQGLYYADVGGSPQQIIHFDELPPPGATLINMMDTLGCSSDGATVLFSWNHGYYSTPPQVGFWAVGAAGAAHQATPDLFRYVYPVQDAPHRIVSADGATVLLYTMLDDENYLDLVDMASGARTTLAQYSGHAPFEYASLSPDGAYARFQAGGSYLGIMDLATHEIRDTLSYYTELSYHLWPPYVSDLVSDGRRYFLGTYLESGAALHRVDTQAGAASSATAPQIAGVWFDVGSIPGDGSAGTTISVSVSDPQADLEWVKIRYVVDGVEHPSWMSYAPLSLDSPTLYDDGTHGDAAAGDGMYGLESVRANPGSSFYERYSLPHTVGVRLVAKDRADNYAIADTSILVMSP